MVTNFTDVNKMGGNTSHTGEDDISNTWQFEKKKKTGRGLENTVM